MFPVVLDQVCTHSSMDLGPLLHTVLLQIFQVSWLSLGNMEFQLLPITFPLISGLETGLATPGNWNGATVVALVVCFGSLSWWNNQPWSIFNALSEGRKSLLKISRYMAAYILCSIWGNHSVPFAEKHPKAWFFQPHASLLVDCRHPSSSSKHGAWNSNQKHTIDI